MKAKQRDLEALKELRDYDVDDDQIERMRERENDRRINRQRREKQEAYGD